MTKIQNKILSVTGVWQVKNRVPGLAKIGRTQGLNIMNEMIEDKILETKKEGRITWVKTNFENTKSHEHEISHSFATFNLTQAIKEIKTYKKLFKTKIQKSYDWQLILDGDGTPKFLKNLYKDGETPPKNHAMRKITRTEKVFVPRTKAIKKDLDVWAMYTDNLIIRIAREEYGVAFGITEEKVSKKWLEDYRTTLKKHVTELLDAFPEEKFQIKRYFQSSVRQFSFKI